jgi:hypothetical protein
MTTQKSIAKKAMKKEYKSEDFGRGKNQTSKKRHRGIIKTKASRLLDEIGTDWNNGEFYKD